LDVDGVWDSLPQHKEGYTQKIFWGRQGYNWREEPLPDLTVTGRRLDAEAPELPATPATNAYTEEHGSFMLAGVAIPTAGCWEITGKYGSDKLTFVVWVEP
jgi:hypothetical protein